MVRYETPLKIYQANNIKTSIDLNLPSIINKSASQKKMVREQSFLPKDGMPYEQHQKVKD